MPVKRKWLWQNPKKRGYMTYRELLCFARLCRHRISAPPSYIGNLLGAHPDLA